MDKTLYCQGGPYDGHLLTLSTTEQATFVFTAKGMKGFYRHKEQEFHNWFFNIEKKEVWEWVSKQ